jgi:hypothetical protein
VTQVNPNREIDAKIVLAIRAGDTAAYRELVEKYQTRIYAMVCGMVRDREEVPYRKQCEH